jgi:type II secretory pathway pseudopilin PulG
METLVATTILAVGLTALAQLFVLSVRANKGSRSTSYAAVLAQQKMEQLRGLSYGFDSIGLPLSDNTTDTRVVPEKATGGTGLAPSPANVLIANVGGYCDFLDKGGSPLASTDGITAPPSTAYTRRWAIQPMPTNPNNTIVIQVLVTSRANRGAADSDVNPAGTRLPDEARMMSVKTRKAT